MSEEEFDLGTVSFRSLLGPAKGVAKDVVSAEKHLKDIVGKSDSIDIDWGEVNQAMEKVKEAKTEAVALNEAEEAAVVNEILSKLEKFLVHGWKRMNGILENGYKKSGGVLNNDVRLELQQKLRKDIEQLEVLAKFHFHEENKELEVTRRTVVGIYNVYRQFMLKKFANINDTPNYHQMFTRLRSMVRLCYGAYVNTWTLQRRKETLKLFNDDKQKVDRDLSQLIDMAA